MEVKKINETIGWIPASQDPLSADVYLIKGRETTWFFDVGCNKEALECFLHTKGKKGIIISHFHPDHMENLKRIELNDPELSLYVGDNTFKYIKHGQIVKEELYIEDGCLLHVLPIPASHAKGSLALEVNQSITLLGDAIYPTQKAGKVVYNAQLLKEEIRVLESLTATKVCMSHRSSFCVSKEAIIKYLKSIYDSRDKNESYIVIQRQLWD